MAYNGYPSGSTSVPSTELIEEICTRFILTAPAADHVSFDRLLFLVEEAYWFYQDVHREQDPSLRAYNLREFTKVIFERCPGLDQVIHMTDELHRQFNEYKSQVPAMGAILLNPSMQKCLLVRGFKAGSGWGFPRGKIANGETDEKCAIREVKEETGYDCEEKLVETDFIEVNHQQRIKLFIIAGVDESTPFAPTVKGEIGGMGWHNISELPATSREATQVFKNDQGGRHKFFNVFPFIGRLRKWIAHTAAANAAGGTRGGRRRGGGTASAGRGARAVSDTPSASAGAAAASFVPPASAPVPSGGYVMSGANHQAPRSGGGGGGPRSLAPGSGSLFGRPLAASLADRFEGAAGAARTDSPGGPPPPPTPVGGAAGTLGSRFLRQLQSGELTAASAGDSPENAARKHPGAGANNVFLNFKFDHSAISEQLELLTVSGRPY